MVHLVGFTIGIYYDARTHECRIRHIYGTKRHHTQQDRNVHIAERTPNLI
jgi:hypothetical protein